MEFACSAHLYMVLQYSSFLYSPKTSRFRWTGNSKLPTIVCVCVCGLLHGAQQRELEDAVQT